MYAVRVNVGTALVVFGLIFLVVFTAAASGASSAIFQAFARVLERLSNFMLTVDWTLLLHSAATRITNIFGGGERLLKKNAERRKG